MDNNNRAAKGTGNGGEHRSLKCFLDTRDIPIETYKMTDDGRKWKSQAIKRKQVHRELASWADPDGKNSCPSLGSLVRATGHSRMTVWRLIQDLEFLGLLASSGKSGYQGTTVYMVLLPGSPIVPDSTAKVSDTSAIVSNSAPNVSDSRPIVSPMEVYDRITVNTEKPLASDGAARSVSLSKEKADPRHAAIKRAYIEGFERDSKGMKADFDGSDGQTLQKLLQGHPELTAEHLMKLLAHAFASDDLPPLGKHFRLRQFCVHYARYIDGPLKKGQPSDRAPVWQPPRPGYAAQQRAKAAHNR